MEEKLSHQQQRPAELPDNVLLECVLARLPLEDLARCRCVCRLWNTYITSAAFRHHARPLEQALLVFNGLRGSCSAYSPHRARWYRLSLPNPTWYNCFLSAAAGSLLLFTNIETSGSHTQFNRRESFDPWQPDPLPEPTRLAVCNPLTGAWRELPPPIHPDRSDPFIGAIDIVAHPFDLHNAHFKVLIAGGFVHHIHDCSTEVYDSLTNSWSMSTEMMPREFARTLTGLRQRKFVYCDGVLYSLGDNTCIMAYELASGLWRKDLVFDVNRGKWDRLKWRVECHAHRLSFGRGSNGRGIFLTAVGALNSPYVCVMGLPYCPDSSLVRWTDDMVHQPPPPPIPMAKIDHALTSANTLYIIHTLAEQPSKRIEVLCWDFMHPSPAGEWTALPPCPFKLHGDVTTCLLV